MPKQSHTFCHCEGAPHPWRSVIPYIPRPLFPSPGPHSLQHSPGGGNMKGTTNSAKIFLESGTGKVCRPPPPRRLEMAIMLSMESMRHHGAWQQKITRPPKSSRVKRSHNSFGPGTGSGPGAAPCVSDLAEQIGITVTVSRGLSPHSAAGINPAHAVPLFGLSAL